MLKLANKYLCSMLKIGGQSSAKKGTTIIGILFTALFGLNFLSSCNYKSEKADVVFHNLQLIDCDGVGKEEAVKSAIAVVDGRIVAIGAEQSIRNAYRADEFIDLKQAFVYPGFIDAHSHFLGYSLNKAKVDLVGTVSYEEVLERVVEYSSSLPINTSWITGRGWDQNDWDTPLYPTRLELDSIFPDRPVAIRRIDGHALLANRKALELAGMFSLNHSSHISGGEVHFLSDGTPSGILVDEAADLLLGKIPSPDTGTRRHALIEGEKDMFKAGLTTVSDAGIEVSDIDLINSLHESGDLSIRVVAMFSGTQPNLDQAFERGPFRTDRLTAEAIKFYMDGALGSRGAALLEPYSDRPDFSGYLMQDSASYRDALVRAHDLEFQVCTHGIGDRAVHHILEHYNEVLGGVNDRRWRIEHSQVVSTDDLHLYKSACVIPSIQPTHATSDMYWAGERLGKGRIRRAYRYQDLKNILGMVPLGTDFPIEDISPLKTYYAATIRKDPEGYPDGGFNMDQALDRNSALLGMTLWASIANKTESEVGSIEVGKWADFVVLDRNLLTTPEDLILNSKILRTVVAGKTVYNAHK